MRNKLAALIVVILTTFSLPQTCRVEGKIYDKTTDKGLYNAAIRIEKYSRVICTNSEGEFGFSYPDSVYTIIASSIGYNSDTISAVINGGEKNVLKIYLSRSINPRTKISLSPIISATEIMEKAIDCSDIIKSRIANYESDIYSRCIVRSNNDLGLGTGSFQLGINKVSASTDFISHLGDSTPLKIKNIYETIGRSRFNTPNNYREVILARNTNSGMPPSMSVLLGGSMFHNFYEDELNYFDQPIPGPLSRKALSYYHFEMRDTLIMDGNPVYKIFLEPIDKNDPGFTGYIYIKGESYSPVQVDVSLNRAANIGGAFDDVIISQQFLPFGRNLYLPVDYRVYATVSYLLFASGSYEMRSVINNYKINDQKSDSINSDAILTIAPGAYKRDMTFWRSAQTLPYTVEESEAYKSIDSLKSMPRGFWEKTYNNLIAAQYEINNNYSISGPSGIYQFNHVEGHTLYLSAMSHHFFDDDIETKVTVSNGFSDKRVKEKLSMVYYLGDLNSNKISFNAYNRLATLFYTSDSYSSLTSTILALFSNHDIRSYYYTKGLDFKVEGDVLSFLNLNAGYSSHSDYSAVYHTNFSLFGIGNRKNTDTTINTNSLTNSFINRGINPPIYDAYISSINFGFNFDFRNFIEDNRLRKRESRGKSYLTFGGGILISDKKILKSSTGFTSYNVNLQGEINTFRSASLGFKVTGVYSNGPVPFQMQYALPGNISAAGKSFTFRTVGLSNLFGDQALTINLEHNFREEILRLLPGRFLQNLNLELTTFFNAAWKNMSPKSAAIMPIEYTILNKPLLEAGFSIGHGSIPVSLEFAWRLTYVDKSSFRIGINTIIL
ncbi:MAG: DUF5686 family protein [Ignavibacteriaceae bacterium]|nr:DUF5686 family protein [Ignavibacteriaceae bacterium]